MRWLGGKGSGNVEDRRGMSGGGLAIGGGVGGLIVLVISLLLGKNPMELLNSDGVNSTTTEQQVAPGSPTDSAGRFVDVVLGTTQDVWANKFEEMGKTYENPILVLFSQRVQSGCGYASDASGPFYCPANSKVYIDLSFYDELRNRFGAPGDFAMAYVIAHEVGHHVQHLLGITDKLDNARGNLSEKEVNALSVKVELQADFLAGVWAHEMRTMKNEQGEVFLEEGDIDEALRAANAIGDDRLQKESQGYVVPDAFTHGTSKQRVYWFRKGFETGDVNQGDTFSAIE